MNLKKYIIKAANIKGRIILTYKNGMMYSAIFELKECPAFEAWNKFRQYMPLMETNINRLSEIGATINSDLKANEKIALWCRVYEHHRQRKYSITPAESGKIQHVGFDEALLNYFFTADEFEWKGKYDIHTFVKFYNVICDKYNHRNSPKPMKYSRKHEQTLTGAALSEYWKLLRAAGYEAVKHIDGSIINWIQRPSPALPEGERVSPHNPTTPNPTP